MCEFNPNKIWRLPSTTATALASPSTKTGGALTRMQRPRVAPSVKRRRNLNIVERSRDVCDDPEDQPQSHPRRADHHSNVLTRETQRNHAKKVQHPVH